MADTIAAITRVDIPVVGHIGLTPQSVHRMGGHRVQGRQAGIEAGGRERLIDDAFAVERAGRLRRRDRGRAPDAGRRDHRQAGRSRRSASAPGPTATGRCSCCTTCSGCPSQRLKFAKQYADLRRGRDRGHRGTTSPRSAAASGPTTSTRSTETRRRHALFDRPGDVRAWSDGGQVGGTRRRARADDGCPPRRPPLARRPRRATPADQRRRVDLRQPAAVRPRRTTSTPTRGRSTTTSPAAPSVGVDAVYAPTAGHDVPAAASRPHVEPGPLGDVDGGRGAARPLPRRHDRRHQAVRRGPPGRRRVRREGLPAAGRSSAGWSTDLDLGHRDRRPRRSCASPTGWRCRAATAACRREDRVAARASRGPRRRSARRRRRRASGTSTGSSPRPRRVIDGEPRARLEYVSVFEPETLEPLEPRSTARPAPRSRCGSATCG